jgi:hypothetical protein
MTMDYELARELRDAGFPQGTKGTWTYPLDALVTRSADRIYVPTLEELVEVCGDWIIKIEKAQNGWNVFGVRAGTSPSDTDVTFIGVGKSLTVGVARLWLGLRKTMVD